MDLEQDCEQGFEEWWSQQPISKVVADHLTLIQQSYKDLCRQAWIASLRRYTETKG